MLGPRQVMQEALFYEFSLEHHVPDDHLLRRIDALMDFSEVRTHLAPFYSSTGRPSVDPELIVRMLVVGYCLGIRSERRLCEEVHLNLAYRWFCRLGLDGAIPDHSTFSKNRHGRFRDSDLLRQLFEMVLRRCIDAGLVGGEGFAVDASLISADANRTEGGPGSQGLDPNKTSRAIKEYIETLDDAAFGAASTAIPRFLSPSDPAARWTAAHHASAIYAYSINYAVDVANAVIVDVEGSSAIRQAEIEAAKRMVDRVQDRFGIKPRKLIADTAYGAAKTLNWLVNEKGIEPHIPVFDKGERGEDRLSRSEFTYDGFADSYTCPAGKPLQQYWTASRAAKATPPKDDIYRYHARKQDCSACPLKPRCCPETPSKKLLRSIHEEARDVARAIATTPEYVVSRCERKKVEMAFAHLKRILKLDRLRLRGPRGANDEFLLAAAAQNLRKMAKLIPA
ncbi:MAG: IS1182 family transposase [Alphaproteobacteria bacterium]|nr:IS1182 family transposase [Alphaproteobacteria bacterium]